ncbi:hypothetical protein JHK87_012529 [Glycine soja]|nr:hypothetical protein JHK87_012529 [Glycine soja]
MDEAIFLCWSWFRNLEKANEELLWKYFKKWGDVREVYIVKRRNREGRRYGFVRFKGVSDAKGLEVKLDNIFINDYKLFVNLPRFTRTAWTEELQQKTIVGRNPFKVPCKPCVVTTGPFRRSYAEVTTKGELPGDRTRGEVLTPTISITPNEGRGYWCNEAWVGKLKKVMAVETLEDRIAWDLGYNIRTIFLGDDMILLTGLSDEKAQLIIQMEMESGNSLFYSLEKWRPGCRPNNWVVWLQVWGFPIEVWEVDHLKKAVSTISDVIELDDDTEDRCRLDRARLLVRTPLLPSIRRDVIVRVGEIEYRVWIVEEIGVDGGSNQKGSSTSDVWSEEITSDDGGDVGDVDDNSNTNFSFSPELSNNKPRSPNIQRSEGGTNGCYRETRPLGKTQSDEIHRDKSEDIEEGTQGLDMAKFDLGESKAETKKVKAFIKEAACYKTQAAARKQSSQQEGNNLNGGDKVPFDQPYNGEAEGDTRRVEPHSDLHPVQPQEDVGPSHNMGPLWKNKGCNKEELFPVAQSSKETPDKYSKVYVRQRHLQYKARLLQPVEDQSQLQEGDNDMAAMIDNRDKAQNQGHFGAERRLKKSKIECNTEVLEEAQQL